MLRTRVIGCLWLATACALPARASAFRFASPASDGCHELISVEAIRRAGWPAGRQAPALSQQERLLARDLPADVDGAKDDPWTLALIIGVRWNDLHGLQTTDLPGLATVHNGADNQVEHCLRSPADDGAAGDLTALRACRRFILDRVAVAIGEGDEIDLSARATATVALAFEGTIAVSVQRYGFEVGRALHALQDSFSHAFRSPDGMRVRHVLNFVDFARDDHYDAARDGHEHLESLDLCSGSEPRRQRRSLAVRASAELLAALSAAARDRAGRLEAADAVVTRWLDHEPGCTIDNAFCDAPERLELTPSCSASTARASSSPSIGALLLATLALLRTRRRRNTPGVRHAAAALLCAATTGLALPASAQDERGAVGLAALVAGSIDESAFAARAGARLRAAQRVEFGLDAELNPWFSLETGQVEPGALNVFGTLIYDWLSADGVTVRTCAHGGASVLLFDLVGAASGSFGPLVGISLIGVSIELAPRWHLLIEPAEVMMPIVKLSPVPFYYRQYRAAIGVQLQP